MTHTVAEKYHETATVDPPDRTSEMDATETEPMGLTVEKRVAISLAVGNYLRAAERFNIASREFTQSCKTMRVQLGAKQRFVVQVDFKHYLVTSDRDGNFDVEPIESL